MPDKYKRIVVITVEGQPYFHVLELARREFIESEVERRYGTQADGSKHEWKSVQVKEVTTEVY